MAYRLEKNGDTDDIVIDGWEKGIAPSPHKGLGNIQNANISTEQSEVCASFVRAQQTQVPITNGTLTTTGSSGTTFTSSSSLMAGQWIAISSTDITTDSTSVTASVQALVIAGGGAGGGGPALMSYGAGGGVAGQLVTNTYSVSPTAYTITVGNGGTGASNAAGGAGQNSSFGALATATGGAGGAIGVNGTNFGAGGAGAGGAGTSGSGTTGGDGGIGLASSISGASVTYAGGAGGGGSVTKGSGINGGGDGTASGTSSSTAGTANTGGGGGGGANNGGSGAQTGSNGGSGIVIISYTTGAMVATGGTITTSGGKTIHTFTSGGTFTVTSVPLPVGNYYVSYLSGSNVKISAFYDPTATNTIHYITSGTATFSTVFDMNSPVAYTTELYRDSSANDQQRYYVLDAVGRVFVYDTANEGTTGPNWFLPDTSISYFGSETVPSGIAVISGWLILFAGVHFFGKPTINLGGTTSTATTYLQLAMQGMIDIPGSKNPHFALVSHQGRCYYTDGNYVGAIFPDSSINSGLNNVQSYGSYTATGTTGTITDILSGSLPFFMDTSNNVKRIPLVFFTTQAGTIPTALTANTVYWLEIDTPAPSATFKVYAAQTGGAALDIATGAVGPQYFNTFYPYGNDAGAGAAHATLTATTQRVNLPEFETAQCLVEIGNTVLIGCKGNTVYPWNQVDATPSNIITLPEANVVAMLTVNQMAYIFCGNQGNIYISDGSLASLMLNIPDYVSGVPGTPGTYIESTVYFKGVMYLRGRVYFSLLDQTTAKTGNCGGVWSFVPTQNMYLGQDTGLALRLESQNSYGTYNGTATLLIPRFSQTANVPLYWAAWYSSVTSPTYGIDYSTSGTSASSPAVIETDFIPSGTMLNKRTLQQIEYKLGAPLDVGATVTMYYRLTPTDAWTACNTFNVETNALSGYVSVNFQQTQWVQLRIILTPITSSADTNTFVRLREVRMR